MTKKAIYPGTFDPLTNGHINIIERAVKLFDHLTVAVAKSGGKNPLFDLPERLALTQQALTDYPTVEVISFEGLLVELARQTNAHVVVRGVRSMADFEYEAQMAGMNRVMMPELETMFLTPHADWADLSSTLIRDIARCQGSISSFVPAQIEQAIYKKLG